MPQRNDRSRSPKRVGGGSEAAWPGLRASLDRVHEAVHALLSRCEADADYLSNTQRVELKEHLDRITEDASQLAQPKEEEEELISKPAQLGDMKLNRTKSQAIGQKRVEYVRSQFDECQVHMTNLVRSVSQLMKDPFPSDVGQLRDALTNVERSQKQARNFGEDLLQFMLDLDDISGLLDEDRNFRRNTMREIDALLANMDEARGHLGIVHGMLEKELGNRQEQETSSFRDTDGVQCAEVDSAWRRGENASEAPLFKDAAQLPQETRPEVHEIDMHPGLLQTASLKRTSSELSCARKAPDEHQVPRSKLARSASLIQEVGTLLRNIEKAQTEFVHQEIASTECANVDRGDDAACLGRQEKEEQEKVAKVQPRLTEPVGKTVRATQPLLVPAGPPTTFAPRCAESYARMAF